MFKNIGLKLRMVIAGSMLFGVYALFAGFVFLTYGMGIFTVSAVLIGSIIFTAFQYKFGKWSALQSVNAKDLPRNKNYRHIHQTVENLSEDMNIDKPKIMVAQMGMPNAFAVGRKGSGVVVLSNEIINLLNKEELDGVIAHEMAHIKNRDVIIMVIGQSIASIVGIAIQIAYMLGNDNPIVGYFVGAILGNIAQFFVVLIVFAISRYREYVADRTAVDYTNNPIAMANALKKISKDTNKGNIKSTQYESVSSLFISEINGHTIQNLVSTHPPIKKRINKLENY